MSFRDNLKKELYFNNILVKELAKVSGVQKRALDTYLLTENPSIPSADVAVRIAKTLGVSVEYLVTGEDTVLPEDIRNIIKRLTKLNYKDRRIVNMLINALIEKQDDKTPSL